MKVVLLTLFTFVTIVSCGQEKSFDEMIDNTIKKSIELVNVDDVDLENSILIDARQLEEFEVSHIQGARFVEYDDFKVKDVKDIDKSQKIIVYCSIGYRSEKIGEKLEKAGYKNVQNLYGGIFAWKNSGKDVVDMKGEKTDRVHTYNKKWGQWLEEGEKVY